MLGAVPTASAANGIHGQVEVGGSAVAGSTVTLWTASASGPRKIDETRAGSNGRFVLSTTHAPKGDVFYIAAQGGRPTISSGNADEAGRVLLALVGEEPPAKLVVNELTTVASAYTADRFIKGDSISGSAATGSESGPGDLAREDRAEHAADSYERDARTCHSRDTRPWYFAAWPQLRCGQIPAGSVAPRGDREQKPSDVKA